jgi:hypothetical protein
MFLLYFGCCCNFYQRDISTAAWLWQYFQMFDNAGNSENEFSD